MWESICARLSDWESLRDICEDEDMPNKSSVFRWLREKVELRDQYARAKEESTDALGEEILDISDDGHNDWMERHYWDDVVWVENKEAIWRSRLRIETRKWLMAKLKPKKYGDKLELSWDETAPLSIVIKLPWQEPQQ